MRVGVYIDGYNLYYGGRGLCGRGTPGWRWLDVRSLAASMLNPSYWPNASIERVVYCTAPISGAANASGAADQDVYLKALRTGGAVDWIERGKYIEKVRVAPLANRGPNGRPELITSGWPVMIKDALDSEVHDATFLVSVAHREEKGSDVNVASHLLIDVLTNRVDAAIVVSNDSDLKMPVRHARTRVPVGTVNPSRNQLAGDLRGEPTDGAGRHWWRQLTEHDFRNNQLADPVGHFACPPGW